MKALKILGVILGITLAVLLVLVFVAPTEMRVERSIKIDAPSDLVFPEISSFSQMDNWSPWAKLDPEMQKEIVGEDGRVGSTYKWSGNELVGKGQQTFTEIDPGKGVKTKINFVEPWESEANAFINLKAGEADTEVVWGFVSDVPKPMNVMNFFMDFSKEVGNDYDKGLKALKEYVEKKASKYVGGYMINEIDMPDRHFLIARQKVSFIGSEGVLANGLEKVIGAAEKIGLEVDGRPSGLYFDWDTVTNETDMAAAIPIASKIPNSGLKLGGISQFTVPAAKAIMVSHYGDYGSSANAHFAIDQYLTTNGLTAKVPCWEEYVTDTSEEPDTSKWLTRVYYFIEE
ncbi:MAG: SRPBCC family protein [Bacteroidota bacterium]